MLEIWGNSRATVTLILTKSLGSKCMSKKPDRMLEKLLRAGLAELKGLTKDMKPIMRRLNAANESLAPTSQEAKEELKARKEEKEAEELEQALRDELKPVFEKS
jgi:hypothetical protein